MKRILYYVTDHGLGHATRSIAIIRELKHLGIEIIVRNTNVERFFRNSLPKIQVIQGITDVGPVIKNDGYSINLKTSKKVIEKWIDKLERTSSQECETLASKKPNLIISDISAMPILAASKMKIPAIAISNFSWYDVIENISNKHKKILKEAYEKADLALKLPFGTPMNHFPQKKKVDLICRKPTMSKSEVKKKLGLEPSDHIVFFALSNSNIHLKCEVNSQYKIISNGVKLKYSKPKMINNWIEGQDLVAAADFVICKCGYGIISECMSNGTPFICLADDHHLEQKSILDDLAKIQIRPKISVDDLQNICVTDDFINTKSIQKQKMNASVIVEHITFFLK